MNSVLKLPIALDFVATNVSNGQKIASETFLAYSPSGHIMGNDGETRLCKTCGETKPLCDGFPRKAEGYYRHECRACWNKKLNATRKDYWRRYHDERRLRLPDEHREIMRRLYWRRMAEGPEKWLEYCRASHDRWAIKHDKPLIKRVPPCKACIYCGKALVGKRRFYCTDQCRNYDYARKQNLSSLLSIGGVIHATKYHAHNL